ncbi:hypothetical protein Asppvi_001999 [Aspergillus pseudoviridinutans]|uniref:Uncharacterized protein n=1 Tax=Aspergillus pseudoviridinutans TaxID=1517512 RepID=A0A9P3BS81_9EURO|nr:uncharacterized protein Asppvi_001999 [Aspergillus pseudoviridinutans]GIJ92721.1 hypothetical protein Asppvi_001999 [Aspergillus pseudoviridinutans]
MSGTGEISGEGKSFDCDFSLLDLESRLKFRGNFDQSFERWQSDQCLLKYENFHELVGTYVIDTEGAPSYIGDGDLRLLFVNHAGDTFEIMGSLKDPISERATVTGQGVWIKGSLD